jgi:hypothetical protein
MSQLSLGLQMAVENAKQGNVRSAWLLEEEIERQGLHEQYLFVLSLLLTPIGQFNSENSTAIQWAVHRAPPERRARAFLQVIEEQTVAKP